MGKDELKTLVPIAVTPEEEKYRKNLFKDLNDVLKNRLFCTCCLNDVKNKSLQKKKAYVHRLFGVLMCKGCYQYYGDGVFSTDEDGTERYCRWCGQGGLLNICSTCTVTICKLCIDRNLSRTERKRVSNDDWQCYNCDPKPLYELRAMAHAFKTILDQSKGKKDKKKDDKNKNPESLEVKKKESCEVIVDSVKLIQKTCRSSAQLLAHMIKNLENQDVAKITNVAEELPKFVKNINEELNSAIVKFTGKWPKSKAQLLSALDKTETVADNNSSADDKVHDSSIEEAQSNGLDEKACSDNDQPEDNVEDVNGEALSDDEGSSEAIVNGKCDQVDVEQNPDEGDKGDENSTESDSKPPLLRIRGIEEINRTVSTPVRGKSKVKKNDSPVIVILSDSESSPEKRAHRPNKKLNDSKDGDKSCSVSSKSSPITKNSSRATINRSAKVDLTKKKTNSLNKDSIPENDKDICDLGVISLKNSPSKQESCDKEANERPGHSDAEEKSVDAAKESGDENLIAGDFKKSSVEPQDVNSKAEKSKVASEKAEKNNLKEEAISSDKEQTDVQSNKLKGPKNNKVKSKDKNVNNATPSGKKTKESPCSDRKKEAHISNAKADRRKSSDKKSDHVTVIIQELSSPSSTSSSDSSSSESSASEPEFVVQKKNGNKKPSRKPAVKAAKVVKGLLTSSDSLSSSDDDLKESKGGKKVSNGKKAQMSSSKAPIKETSTDEGEDKEFKQLLNLKSLKKKKGESTKDSNGSSKLENKAAKKPKNKGPSLLDEVDSGDDLWPELRNDFDSILSTLPGAETSNLEIPDFQHSELSDVSDDANGSRMSIDSDDVDNLFANDKKKKKLLKRKKKVENDGADNLSDDDDNKDNSDLDCNKNDSWKNDKLLKEKLSGASSDEDIFASSSKKKSRANTVLDDSEEEISNAKAKKVASVWTSDSDSSSSLTQKKGPKKRRRIKNSSDSDENLESSTPKGRKNIKKIKKSDNLNLATQTALQEEQERKERIAERQRLYNELIKNSFDQESSNVDKLVLEFDLETKNERIAVDKELVKKLKPHQASGIKFMWDSCYETVSKAKKNQGSGCILAHCMGLGKTLQVITLVHTLLKYDELNVKTVLVLCPLSTVLNWASEFEKWLSDVGSGEDVNVFHFSKSTLPYRSNTLRDWQRRGGVMIIGYSLFRTLVFPTKRIKPAYAKAFLETLTDPGADLVICDEGHILKNEATAISKAVSKIKTLRRIVLTGTPLQNNLIEYHCMVQFVKPLLLGTKKEFTNRFVNPIQNGQFVDSTPQDVKVMKRRAHVLHKMLDGIVQRKDYNVLVPFLPPKFEYVLGLNLTPLQVKLYQTYLDKYSSRAEGPEPSGKAVGLFKDKSILHLICSHPRLLRIQAEQALLKKEMDDLEDDDEEGSLKDFIDDGTSSESDTTTSSSSSNSDSDDSGSKGKKKSKPQRRTRNTNVESEEEAAEAAGEKEEENDHHNGEWWSDMISEEDMEDIKSSTKLFLLFKILEKCHEIGDKLLVFSQSLYVLDLIEYFLGRIDDESHSDNPPENLRGFQGTWIKGLDYFRLDGSSASENRAIWCNKFNDPDNFRGRLFLISTRAGGMGINLTGANRVVIFDASWNPSHDVQSIFRIFRFGQEKPCYIYRFLSKGTMEQKIYDRQVTKLSMSCRVVDEQQVDRHFSYADLNELYTFTPNDKDDKTFIVPKDLLLADILSEGKDLVLSYHSHDSLLENQANEELNEEERKAAWYDFENEKKQVQTNLQNPAFVNYVDIYNKALQKLEQEHPEWSETELRNAAKEIVTTVLQPNLMAGSSMMAPQHAQPMVQMQQQSQLQALLMQQQQMIQQQRMWQLQQNHMLQNSMAQMQGNPRMMQRAMPQYQGMPMARMNRPQILPRPSIQPQQLMNPYAVRQKGLPAAKNPVESNNLEKR